MRLSTTPMPPTEGIPAIVQSTTESQKGAAVEVIDLTDTSMDEAPPIVEAIAEPLTHGDKVTSAIPTKGLITFTTLHKLLPRAERRWMHPPL
jgi:hypothetical protein